MKMILASIAACFLATASSAQGAPVTYTLAGSFDVSVGADEYDNLDVTLTGTSDTGAIFFPLGPDTPAVVLTSLSASAVGHGDVPLENLSSFFSNNDTGIAGFSDMVTGDFITFTGLAPYDARSSLAPTLVKFSGGGKVGSPLGDATILSASNLTFSAVVSGVPEAISWIQLIAGLFGTGALVRYGRRRRPRLAKA